MQEVVKMKEERRDFVHGRETIGGGRNASRICDIYFPKHVSARLQYVILHHITINDSIIINY